MSSSGGGKRKEPEEEHVNHERWLVTYADMITLLMVLFIVLFAMSTVDQKKFNALKAGLAAGFGQSNSVLDGSSSILDDPGTSAVAAIDPDIDDTDQLTKVQRAAVQNAVAKLEQQRTQRAYADAESEVDRLQSVQDRVEAALRAHGLADDVKTSIDDRGLTVSLISKHIVFEPNMADLTDRGQEVISALAPVLRELPDPLEIDGHTNQAAGKPKYYDNDWDLSAARAINVLGYLTSSEGIDPSRLSASAFGSEKPLMNPDKPGSQEINKRVDIVVLSSAPAETKSLIDTVVDARHHTRTPEGAL